jgi:Cof subfamily protein (haloacid dehalogenase superfamily)
MVYDRLGNIIYERFLEPSVIGEVESFCDSFADNPGLLAYNEDRVFCTKFSAHTECLKSYQDSAPQLFPTGLRKLHLLGFGTHKLILMHHPEFLSALRPALENLVNGVATITQAVPNMLEVLPYGASKGDGVRRLLEHYNYSPSDSIAFGDGENDIEMFQLVELGAAVTNANPKLKAVADIIIPSNNEDGVAQTIEEMIRQK